MGAAPESETGDLHATADQTAIKGMCIKPFDPSKPDTYKAWDTAFTSGVSASTAAAIKIGKPPTFEQAQIAMGCLATRVSAGWTRP